MPTQQQVSQWFQPAPDAGRQLYKRLERINTDIIATAVSISNGLGGDFTYLDACITDAAYDLQQLESYYTGVKYSFKDSLPIVLCGLQGHMSRLRGTYSCTR